MEQKTTITALDGKQELFIHREFELPVALLFRAYTDPAIVAQWMGTTVLKLENERHGCYQFETTDPKGNTHRFSGVIHAFSPNEAITRTFEIEGASLGAQLEFLEFEALTGATSKLTMQIVYRSVAHRDQMVKMGMPMGINLAHNRLQTIANTYK